MPATLVLVPIHDTTPKDGTPFYVVKEMTDEVMTAVQICVAMYQKDIDAYMVMGRESKGASECFSQGALNETFHYWMPLTILRARADMRIVQHFNNYGVR